MMVVVKEEEHAGEMALVKTVSGTRIDRVMHSGNFPSCLWRCVKPLWHPTTRQDWCFSLVIKSTTSILFIRDGKGNEQILAKQQPWRKRRFRGKFYRVLVNGQNGKVAGEYPVSMSKQFLSFVLMIVVSSCVRHSVVTPLSAHFYFNVDRWSLRFCTAQCVVYRLYGRFSNHLNKLASNANQETSFMQGHVSCSDPPLFLAPSLFQLDTFFCWARNWFLPVKNA